MKFNQKIKQMKKRIIFKAINGMTIEAEVTHVTGFGTNMADGTYLTVETVGGSFPVHPDDRRKVWGAFMPEQEGGGI